MPSDLKPSEKEEREVERLIGRKPAPSRKSKPKRGPKHDNRRRRMKVDDPDLKSSDKDMSLNYKHSFVRSIAFRIADGDISDLGDLVSGSIESLRKDLASGFYSILKSFDEWYSLGIAHDVQSYERLVNMKKKQGGKLHKELASQMSELKAGIIGPIFKF